MFDVMSLTSYVSAMTATGVFWFGVTHESMLVRIGGAAIATFGIWVAESAERRTRSARASQAATLNGLLLLVMAVISLYLHFAE